MAGLVDAPEGALVELDRLDVHAGRRGIVGPARRQHHKTTAIRIHTGLAVARDVGAGHVRRDRVHLRPLAEHCAGRDFKQIKHRYPYYATRSCSALSTDLSFLLSSSTIMLWNRAFLALPAMSCSIDWLLRS